MANLKLKNPSGGSLNFVSADGASDLTVTFPATTGTAMVSGNMPAFCVNLSGSQSISSGTWTKINLNAETFDTANAFDSTTNYRFTPQVAGYYQINGAAAVNGTGTTQTGVAIYKNGSVYQYASILSSTISGSTYVNSVLLYLNGSSDYVELYAFGNGTTVSVTGAQPNTQLSGCLVRAA
jgi:hypothetical protein